MAISRVPGFSLLPNLDRQGIDLEFTTQGNTLVYMDFANFKLGINTTTPQESLEVNGNVLVSNGSILSSGNLSYNLGSSTNWWNTLFVGNITAGNFVAGNVDGVLTTSTQPYITSLGTLVGLDINGNLSVSTQILPTSNSSGTIGNASLWWGTVYANVINSPNINGTILTANQPFITNLGNISVDSITIGGNISISGNTNGGVINADELYEANYRVLTTNTTITVNGDVTGSGTYTNVYVDLINSGISASTYGSNVLVPQITFDSKGRATSATNLTLEQVGNVSVVDNTITSLSGDLNFASNVSNLSVSGTILASQITANQLTVASADIGGAEILTTNSNIVVGGDVVGYGTNANVYVGLTTTGVSPGTYGSSNQVPQIVVDDKGRVTYAANIAITSNIGNLTVSDTTISSLSGITLSANANVNITTTGNIVLDAGGYGVVIMQGTDAFQMPSGNTANRPGYPAVGYTRFNTEVGSIEYWDGTVWTVPGFSTITSETIYPDGSANTYTLSSNTTTYSVFVSINGTVQQPVTAYNVYNDNQIVFTEVPAVTDVIEVRHFAAGVTITALQYGNTKVEPRATEVEITGHLVPTANITYDLGSPTNWWKDLYLSGNTIYLGGLAITNNNGVLTSTVDGNLTTLQANDPVDSQDVVTLGYLNTTLNAIDTSLIQQDDTSVQIIDDGIDAGNIVVAVDGSNVAKVGSSAVELYRSVVVTGNISANVFTYPNGQSILTNITSAWEANAASQAGDIATLYSNAATQLAAITDIQTNYANRAGATFTGEVTIPTLFLTNALATSQGGTGATSLNGVGGALDNLLPSGEQSGYVLKTSGAGTYFWGAEATSGGATVGQQLTTQRQANVIVSNTKVISLSGITYIPGAGQLRVYINGLRQPPSAYTETSNVSYTFMANVVSGDTVFTEIDQFSSFNNYANLTYASNIGNIATSGLTVQTAIDSLETTKAPLGSPVFTGTLTAPAAKITNSTQSSSPTTGALIVTGGVGIGGNLNVSGNLNIAGNVTYFSSNDVVINDAMIYLADDNTGDVLDIGIVSSFTDAVRYQHTGLVRDASDGQWKLFANVVAEPTTTVDFTNATYSNIRVGVLTASSSSVSGNVSAAGITAGNITASSNISVAGDITQNGVAGGIIPRGGIIMWSGSIAGIPTGWALCNGSNGTPDLRDRFVVGAGSAYSVAATGGSADAIVVSHTHSATSTFTGTALGTHTHSASSSFSGNPLSGHSHTATVTDPGHRHTFNTLADYSTADAPANANVAALSGDPGGGNWNATNTFNNQNYINTNTTGISVSLNSVSAGTPSGSVSTSIGSTSAGTPSGSVSTTITAQGSSGTNANLPPYYALAFIMKL